MRNITESPLQRVCDVIELHDDATSETELGQVTDYDEGEDGDEDGDEDEQHGDEVEEHGEVDDDGEFDKDGDEVDDDGEVVAHNGEDEDVSDGHMPTSTCMIWSRSSQMTSVLQLPELAPPL